MCIYGRKEVIAAEPGIASFLLWLLPGHYSVVYFPLESGHAIGFCTARQNPLNPCSILTIHRATSGQPRGL